MDYGVKFFLLRIVVLIVLAPLGGYAFLRFAEYFVKCWKSRNRRKMWVAMTSLFLAVAIIGGWLR